MSNQKIQCIEQIIRNKVYMSSYWKEKCFSLNSESIIDNALELKCIGGIISTSNHPTDFICLVVKLLQINPSEEILDEYLSIPEYKYLRALTALFIRLTYPSVKIYQKLEPLYNDYRKLRMVGKAGNYEIIHMDEYIDELLMNDQIFEISLPKLVKRKTLEEKKELGKRVSMLDGEFNDEDSKSEGNKEGDIFDDFDLPDDYFKENKNKKENNDNDEEPENKGIKKFKINEKENKIIGNLEENEDNIEPKEEKLDENSDEYWLALRKKLGLS